MKDILIALKDYWPIIVFSFALIGGTVTIIFNMVKLKIPSLDRRVKKMEKNVFDDKGNEMIITVDNCIKNRDVCNNNICGKIDGLEEVIKQSTKATAESLKENTALFSASVKDLHEKREAATQYTNEQITKLTLAVGGVQGELKRIKNGGRTHGNITNS